MKKKILIEGMSCGHCVNHVKEALIELGGKGVDVNLDKKLAIAEFGDDITNEKIKLVIEDVGYDVVEIEKL